VGQFDRKYFTDSQAKIYNIMLVNVMVFEPENLLFLIIFSKNVWVDRKHNMIQKYLFLITEIFHIFRNEHIVYFVFMLLQSFLASTCAKFPNTYTDNISY
jgi:hypothetical protein